MTDQPSYSVTYLTSRILVVPGETTVHYHLPACTCLPRDCTKERAAAARASGRRVLQTDRPRQLGSQTIGHPFPGPWHGPCFETAAPPTHQAHTTRPRRLEPLTSNPTRLAICYLAPPVFLPSSLDQSQTLSGVFLPALVLLFFCFFLLVPYGLDHIVWLPLIPML
ncbi:hypothetical protein LY78DRAFT_235699 [Colletotrichum sublineola]|nr:hypothetical protein LY78DRAFT_235699 [Colletotrichum sublineola]